jgi:hypothetical protein
MLLAAAPVEAIVEAVRAFDGTRSARDVCRVAGLSPVFFGSGRHGRSGVNAAPDRGRGGRGCAGSGRNAFADPGFAQLLRAVT